MNEALLTILSALVMALIWVVKWLVARSDRNLEQRDNEVQALIKQLTVSSRVAADAVRSFRIFEKEEEETHREILRRLDTHENLLNGIVAAQEALAQHLERIADKLGSTS